jgi:hypothetical protein
LTGLNGDNGFPKVEDNERNRVLARWLDERDVISSFDETLLGGKVRINTFREDGS